MSPKDARTELRLLYGVAAGKVTGRWWGRVLPDMKPAEARALLPVAAAEVYANWLDFAAWREVYAAKERAAEVAARHTFYGDLWASLRYAMPFNQTCNNCQGTGRARDIEIAASGGLRTTCSWCFGQGTVRVGR